jgi:hypothetical protein
MSRRERDPMTKHSKVGNAVELAAYEKTECGVIFTTEPWILLMLSLVDVFDNSEPKVDLKPLYHCIHIYTALDSLDELRKSYQADRRVRHITLRPFFLLACHRLNRNRPSQPQCP